MPLSVSTLRLKDTVSGCMKELQLRKQVTTFALVALGDQTSPNPEFAGNACLLQCLCAYLTDAAGAPKCCKPVGASWMLTELLGDFLENC